MGISNFNIKQLKKKYHQNSGRKTFVLPPNQYQSILVLSDSNLPLIESQVKKHFKNANITFLTQRDKKEDESVGKIFSLHKSDVSFGKLKNERLQLLLRQEFELLIDFNRTRTDSDIFIELVKTNLISGHYNSEKNYLYDIFLEGENLIENLYNQLNKLTSNGNK